MRLPHFYIIIFISIGISKSLYGQGDTDPPVPPLFTLVSVQPEIATTILNWVPSTSLDVAGYVVYNYKNGEGFAIDTIHNPYTSTYLYTRSFSSYLTESYVIAAIDSSGNFSPLSNELSTVFTIAQIDTCNKKISISWNKYKNFPKTVAGYKVLYSVNGGVFSEAGQTDPSVVSLTISNFTANDNYCFKTAAILEDGSISFSNKTCLQTGIQRAPQWINADYATTETNNDISLSFSVDPISEINTFRLERMAGKESGFSLIAQIESKDRLIKFTDKTADPLTKNYYRLLAVNNCGNPVVSSNLSANIITKLEKTGSIYNLQWNPYRFWLGVVSGYTVYINEGGGFHYLTTVSPSDSVYQFNYETFMYNLTGGIICFSVGAAETGNPHGISGVTISSITCSETIEIITAPNTFTPNDDLTNDLFRPVLSFTPVDYHIIVTDKNNNILFESRDFMKEWDGKKSGAPLPQGVYLWYLKLKTPTGKLVNRTGTVTIIR